MTEDNSQQPAEADGSQESQPELSAAYDSYRSLADSNLIVVVPRHAVPPFRFKAGGWELLQSSIELDSAAKACIAETGFFVDSASPTSSGELVPNDAGKQVAPSLEVEFALVIAGMIETVRNSPEDIRKVVYDLARHKLQEQLLHADAAEKEHTQRALEGAIRGVEAFSKKQGHILPRELPPQLNRPQLNGPDTGSADRNFSHAELVPQVELRPRFDSPWPYLRRTAALIVILVAVLVAIQQREGWLYLAHPARLEGNAGERSTALVSTPPPAKSAALRPTDYGVYAIGNDSLIDLSSLLGRLPDMRVAVSPPLTTPSRTILPNGHPRFIVFSRDLASSVADRAEVRIIAKVAREFSAKVAGKKPAEDAWVIRNISFAFRSSPVNDNAEMSELHSEDPALELPPGRYALVLKTQAYDFSVGGSPVNDPRHCIERIIGTTGIFYSECKNP